MLSNTLTRGDLGIELVLPDWPVREEDEIRLQFTDDRQQHWWYFWKPNVQFDLMPGESFDGLRTQIDRYARAMFVETFQQMKSSGQIFGEEPRTADGTWSPVIEAKAITVANQPALQLIHRMSYPPGPEVLLGHTILPAAKGTLEVRWMNSARLTGLRESALMMKRMKSHVEGLLEQREYDDPKHDGLFPDHPLSMSRIAANWHVNAVKRVIPAAPFSRHQQVKGSAGISTWLLPPRFGPGEWPGWFTRLSFCCTDGLEHLSVTVFRPKGFFSKKRSPKEQVQDHLAGLVEQGPTYDLSMNGCEGLVIEPQSDSMVSSMRTVAVWRKTSGFIACAAMVSPLVNPVEEVATQCAETLATVKIA